MLSEHKRQEMLTNTKESAAAFVDQMQHLRALIERDDFTRTEVALAGIAVRRLVVSEGGDLPRIAAPRIGKIRLQALVNPDTERAVELGLLMLYVHSGIELYGRPFSSINLGEFMDEATINKPEIQEFLSTRRKTLPTPRVSLDLGKFRDDKVIYVNGIWIDRASVIDFAINANSVAHSRPHKEDNPKERALAFVRNAYVVRKDESGNPQLNIELDFQNRRVKQDTDFIPRKENEFDPTLIQLLDTMYSIVLSVDTQKLEAVIREELKM